MFHQASLGVSGLRVGVGDGGVFRVFWVKMVKEKKRYFWGEKNMHRSLKTPKALNRRGFRSQKSLFFGFTPFRLDFVVSSAMISATNAAFCETTTNGRALATAQEKKYRHEESGLFERRF